MTDAFATIIIRSYNEAWALRETLPALAAQDYRSWELIVIDSGSNDGSVELIRSARPRHFVQITSSDYNPSRVMNHAFSLAASEFGIFLNADATPQGSGWLRPLVESLQNPRVAAVFGRQIPRPGCRAVYACDYDRCFGPRRESLRWRHFFSMVSSGVRRDVWEPHHFAEGLQYSEDWEFTSRCLAAGFQIVYRPESVVMHSHNYTPAEAYKRSFGEAHAQAFDWNVSPDSVNFFQTLLGGWLNDLRRDVAFCARSRRWGELPHAMRIRWRQRHARLAGFKAGWREHRASGMPALQ